MRTFSQAFKDANLTYSREPITVVKIETSVKSFWITSKQITLTTSPGDFVSQGTLTACSGSSQKITPERGFSTIGTISFSFSDVGFTAELRDLLVNNNLTINTAKTTVYWGYEGMAIADFAYAPPMYVIDVSNNDLSYTIKIDDAQRFTKKSAFGNRPTTTVDGGIGTGVGSLGVLSTDGFELVNHGADWVGNGTGDCGYLKIRGTYDGEDIVEYLRYDSKTATSFNVVERGVFGTKTINIQSSTSNTTIEVEEVIYLALPAPKMIIALLTNALYGQVGETIPDHWGAQIDASLVDIASLENIGDDIWSVPLEFIDVDETDIKRFIAEQCLSVLNMFARINQDGQLSISRFGSLDDKSPSGPSITYENLLSAPQINRNVKHIRNNFLIKWEYRPDQERFARSQLYVDDESATRNGDYVSAAYTIELRGIRNISRYSGLIVNLLAQSIRARFSDAAINFGAEVLMRDTIQYEVGDVVTVALENQPFESTDDYFQGAMEIQGINWDFLNGTINFDLFTTTGRATPLFLNEGDDVTEAIDHTGWTQLTTGALGTVSGDNFLVANGASFNGKYWFDGDIVFDEITTPGFTCYLNESVVFDCRDVELIGSPRLDGVGRGIAGAHGFYGGGDTSDLAFDQNIKQVLLFSDVGYKVKTRDATDGPFVPVSDPKFASLKPRVDENNVLQGIPEKLYGNGSAKGGRLFTEFTEGSFAELPGGVATAGGAGVLFICDNFIYDALTYDPVIDTSGANGQLGSSQPIVGAGTFHAGASGYGWPGVCMVYLKRSASVAPIFSDFHVAKTGANAPSNWKVTLPIGNRHYKTVGGENYGPPSGPSENGKVFEPLTFLANKDMVEYGQPVNYALTIKKDSDKPPTSGQDTIGSAVYPVVVYEEALNTPKTPLGDQSTITLTASARGGDPNFAYALFEYRLKGADQFVPIAYDLPTKSNFTVTSSGDVYEVRATAYNADNKPGGRVVFDVLTTKVVRDSDESAGGAEAPDEVIALPPIRGFELVNRISNDDFDKFKSPNAEFRWLKSSNTFSGDITQLNGAVDLHLEGYKVRVSKTDGTILREEVTKDSFYTYTFDKNKVDNAGTPIREFKVEVQAVATTGYVSLPKGFVVENPAPAAPSGVVFSSGFSTIEAIFTLPNDVDFLGVEAFIVEGVGDPYADGTSKQVASNSAMWEGLTAGQTYTIGLRSLDQFGTGGQISATGVQTKLIESSALGDITTPVVIDENGGRLITNNSGYVAFHGATDVPAESASPLIFGAFDGASYPFWIDAGGSAKLTGNVNIAANATGAKLSVGSSTFESSGIQFEYNAGAPRAYIGDGANNFLKFEGDSITLGEDTTLDGVPKFNNTKVWNYDTCGLHVTQVTADASWTVHDITTDPALIDAGCVISFQGGTPDVFIAHAARRKYSVFNPNVDWFWSQTRKVRMKIAFRYVNQGGNGVDYLNVGIGAGYPGTGGISSTGFVGVRMYKSGTWVYAKAVSKDGTTVTVSPSTYNTNTVTGGRFEVEIDRSAPSVCRVVLTEVNEPTLTRNVIFDYTFTGVTLPPSERVMYYWFADGEVNSTDLLANEFYMSFYDYVISEYD